MEIRTRLSTLACLTILAAAGVAGCSSSPAATLAPGGGGGGGGGGQSLAPIATQPAVPSIAIGGGGGAGTDVEAVANALVPPNSSQITKTTAQDTWFVVYESTDSVDTLKAFYESAIPKAGMQIISTTTIQGGISWVIAKDASGSFGGAVSVIPSSDGKTTVQVTVGKT